jgi:bacteriophage N4 adsorption protein B
MMSVMNLLDWALVELLLLSSVGFLILGFDELIVDIVWFVRQLARSLGVYRRHNRMTAADIICRKTAHNFAVFIPAWDESPVIEAMLKNSISAYRGKNVAIFVGCYKNDPDTIKAVKRAANHYVHLVICESDGPTTKADCLNNLWWSMNKIQAEQRTAFKAVILHDAEDFVHEDEISVFDYLADRFDLIQLPVIPLLDPKSNFISGHYCDEFAESHTKALAVREALGAALPSAGVGCAISFKYLKILAGLNPRGPFDEASLTEDYELGIGISKFGLRAAFVSIPDRNNLLPVGTRAYFPGEFKDSVRQKSRWMIGIALAGWDRLGWGHGIIENWMRLRDRAAILSAILVAAAYVALFIACILYSQQLAFGRSLPDLSFDLILLLKFNSALLFWRLTVRFAFVTRLYGWKQGVWSVPRMVVGNAIAILAARRAVWIYIKSLRGRPLFWDKTPHSFPVDP